MAGRRRNAVEKQKIALFLPPDVAKDFAVIAAEANMDRSALVTAWVRQIKSPPVQESQP